MKQKETHGNYISAEYVSVCDRVFHSPVNIRPRGKRPESC